MKNKTVEKCMAIFSILLLLAVLYVFFWLPNVFREDMTNYYNLYKEIESFTNTPALEEYLEEKEIHYTKEIGDIYIYTDSISRNKRETIRFVWIKDDCEIVEEKYATNFKRLDSKENIDVVQKEGKTEISFEKDGKEYIFYNGRYYMKPAYNKFWFNVIRIIYTAFVLFVSALIISAFFISDKTKK